MPTTLYWVVYAGSGSIPSGGQIVSGQNATGSAALASGSEPYTSPGIYDEASAISTLSPSSAYRVAWVAYDGTTYSNVVESAEFTTLSAAGLCLLNGAITFKNSPLAGDQKIYLTSIGSLVAKTSPGAGDRIVYMVSGMLVA